MKFAILSSLALSSLALSPPALRSMEAQPIEVRRFSQLATLDGDWKVSAGDDPRFAAPEFDDSAGRTVRVPGEALTVPPGTFWIRFQVQLPDSLPPEPLALLLPPLGQSYDLFVNGRQLGSFGNLRLANGWGATIPAAAAFAIPSGLRQFRIAIRNRTLRTANLASRSAWIGTAPAIAGKQRELELDVRWRSVNHLIVMGATAMAGLFFLLLPVWRRDGREYFWCGCFLLAGTLVRPLSVAPWMLEGFALPLVYAVVVALAALQSFAWERLFTLLLGVRLSAWGRRCQQGSLLWLMTVCVLVPFFLDRVGMNRVGYIFLLTYAVQLGVYLDLVHRSPRREETLWMHTAVALYLGGNIVYQVLTFLPGGSRDLGDLALTVRGVGSLLFAGVMAMVLNRRSARLQDEQQRLAQEMRAGAEMQEILLPAGAIRAPGFTIEAAYLPMSEVGGDFYFTRAEPDGGLLVVVGDVSGKGLKAAMLVSVTIGMLRTEKSSSPAVILGTMNDGLTGHMGGGFVTCCCARFDADGTVTLANAGNPAPCCDGLETAVEGGLPLGVLAGVEYGESAVRGERFTFVSDGVVEAANASRELFGFERTRQISGKSAREIVEAAKAWGQNDDITVVTVRRNS